MRSYSTFRIQDFKHLKKLENTPLASLWARMLAFLIDMTIVLGVIILYRLLLILHKHLPSTEEPIRIHIEPFHKWEDFLVVLLYFGFATYFGHGQTFGKRILRIRVVSLSGNTLRFWQCLERALGYAASALEAGFGFIQAFWHPNRQTVHDRIAETVVIQTKRRFGNSYAPAKKKKMKRTSVIPKQNRSPNGSKRKIQKSPL